MYQPAALGDCYHAQHVEESRSPLPPPSNVWERRLLKRYRTGCRHTGEQKDTFRLWKDKLGVSGSVLQPVLAAILPMLGISAFLLYLRGEEGGRGLR